jgi:putative DNA primase/helicase
MRTFSTDELEVDEIVQPARARKSGNGRAQKEPAEILDPNNPMNSARVLRTKKFTSNSAPTLWRHRGCFLLWTGSYFARVDEETIRTYIWTFLEKAKRQQLNKVTGRWEIKPFKPKRAHVAEITEALTALCQLDEHIDPPAWLPPDDDSNPPAGEFFACGNGLLHLPSGKLHAATPTYFCLNASAVIYDAKAKAPQWLAFLHQLNGKDQQATELLQDWYGYALTPDTSQQKIIGIIGPKRSGKGTLARIATRLLGASSVAGPTMNSLGETFGLEPLITKSLAIISDVRIGKRTETSIIVERLLSISGEDRITVARKFLQAWHGKLPTRIVFLSNELLALTDGSGAFASRLMIILLTKSFYGKEDPQLTSKLATELSGILNWAIVGYRRLTKRGYFVQPESAREVVEDIETLGSPIKAFVRDLCEVGPGLSVAIDSPYRCYKHVWCEAEGRKDPGTKEWFGRNLHSAVPGLKTTRPQANTGKPRSRIYKGIRLRPGVWNTSAGKPKNPTRATTSKCKKNKRKRH